MKYRYNKRLFDCIRCINHIKQTSGAVICGFSRGSGQVLPLVMCDDPSNDFIEGCPRELSEAGNTGCNRKLIGGMMHDELPSPFTGESSGGDVIKLF